MLLLLFIVVVVCDKLSTAELGVKLPIAVEFNVMRVFCFSKIFLLFKVETVQQIKLEQLFVYLLFYCSSVWRC